MSIFSWKRNANKAPEVLTPEQQAIHDVLPIAALAAYLGGREVALLQLQADVANMARLYGVHDPVVLGAAYEAAARSDEIARLGQFVSDFEISQQAVA